MSTRSQFYTLRPDAGYGTRYSFQCDEHEVGSVVLIRYPHWISVWSLEIYPEYRHLGHARALMNNIYALAIHDGHRKVWLRVDKDNDPALELYKSEGFIVVEERGHDYAMERTC